MQEAFNHIVVREYGTNKRIRSIDLENDHNVTFTPVTGQYQYEDLQAKDWPEFTQWQEPQEESSESSEEDSALQELDSRLSKITLKF